MTISPNETGGSLHDRLAQLAPEALLEALDQLANQTAPRTPAGDGRRHLCSQAWTREDGKIDWSEPAETIERKIRAFDPWPGAFTQSHRRRGKARHLKIFRATFPRPDRGDPAPSSALTIAVARRHRPRALRLDEVQLEGKRRMSAAEFLRGFSSPTPHF